MSYVIFLSVLCCPVAVSMLNLQVMINKLVLTNTWCICWLNVREALWNVQYTQYQDWILQPH